MSLGEGTVLIFFFLPFSPFSFVCVFPSVADLKADCEPGLSPARRLSSLCTLMQIEKDLP